MEGDKKRKRTDNAEVNGSDRGKKEGELAAGLEMEAEAEDEAAAQPSEEEVEEFFTILRRMQVAVKYFEKAGANINDINGDGGRKIAALEKAEIDGVKASEKRGVAAENGGLDLNAVPEAES